MREREREREKGNVKAFDCGYHRVNGTFGLWFKLEITCFFLCRIVEWSDVWYRKITVGYKNKNQTEKVIGSVI